MALTTSTMIGLAALAAGTGLQMHNTNRTLSRQDAEQAQGIQRRSRIQSENDRRVNEEVDALENSTADDARKQRTSEFMQALAGARRQTESGLDMQGLGSAYEKAAGQARSDVAARGANDSRLLGIVDAAGIQRQNEGQRWGRLATDLSLQDQRIQSDNFLTNLRTAAIRRNQGMDMAGSLLQGVGSGMATGAMGPGAKAASTPAYGTLGMSGPMQNQLIAAMRGMA